MAKTGLSALLSTNSIPWTLVLFLSASLLHLDLASASARLWFDRLEAIAALRLLPVDCPAAIGFGETIACALLSPFEIDTYTFTAAAGDNVLVRLSVGQDSFVPAVSVYSPANVMLCTDQNSYPAEISSCVLPTSGDYTILVRDFLGGETGSYHLYLQRLNNPGGPLSIAFGSTLSGSIGLPAEMDTYTFTAAAGDKVLLRLSSDTSSITPDLRLFSPAGTLLCHDYNSYPAEISSCDLPAAGAYSILLGDFLGTTTGEYHLYLQRLNNPLGSLSIVSCQSSFSSIDLPAEMDTYSFPAAAGDQVLVRLSADMSSIVPDLRVFSPSGALLCRDYNSYPAEIASCDLPTTGIYSILVGDLLGYRTGAYRLFLQSLHNPPCPPPVWLPFIAR